MEKTSVRPATSLRAMCETVAELGGDPATCLKNTGITPEQLTQPDLRLTLAQEVTAIENLVRLFPNKVGLGVSVARRLHLGAFGIYGFAILTSPTARAAAETAVRFANLSYVVADMSLVDAGTQSRLEFDLSDLPEAVHWFVLERHTFVAMTFFRDFLQEKQFSDFSIQSTHMAQIHADRLADMLQLPVQAGRDVDALTFPTAMLDQPLPKSDPVTQQYCIDQCNELLSQTLGGLSKWSLKVRNLLVANIGSNPKIDAVAARLNMTERTLRRRLKDEGTTYRKLFLQARLTLARQLLERAGLTVETVSWRVGYAEPAAFVRAFSKEFGDTPGSVRAGVRKYQDSVRT